MAPVSESTQPDPTLNTLSIFLFWFFIGVTVASVTIAMVTLHRAKKRERALAKSDMEQLGEPAGASTVVVVQVPESKSRLETV